MKKVFSNTSEVVHVFAQQSQSEGRNGTSSIYFKDNKISNIQLENNNNTIEIDDGEHIICLNPFIYQKILENSNVNNI